MNIGIDKIGFFVPAEYGNIAEARGVEPAKYTVDWPIYNGSSTSDSKDIVTLAANAALSVSMKIANLLMILLGQKLESINQNQLPSACNVCLGYQSRVRGIRWKHACYGATAATIERAYCKSSFKNWCASDIAKIRIKLWRGTNTKVPGAVAMIVSDPFYLF